MVSRELDVPAAVPSATGPQEDQPPSQQQQREEKGEDVTEHAEAQETSNQEHWLAGQARETEALRKRETVVSFGESAAGSGTFSRYGTSDFRRQRTALGAVLPSQFFQSRASIRVWGAEELTDPMVQPYDPDDPSKPSVQALLLGTLLLAERPAA